jgi:sulfonate transport system substrate-binding protein
MNFPPSLRPFRRFLVVTTVALTASASLTACGSKTGNEAAVLDNGKVDLSKVTLTVGDQKGGSKALLSAAGELDDLPYKIQWKSFTSGPPLLEALNAGAIDVGGVGNTPPLFAAAGKSKIEVVSGATMGAKGDTIVVPKDSDIKTVADLKGKKVAVAEGSSANYNLLAQLGKAGLSYKDISVQNLQPADALAAFTAKHVDAWAIWDPYTAVAQEVAHARILHDGQGLVGGLSFQVASPEALQDPAKVKALRDYLSRLAQARVWALSHTEEWAKVWAQLAGISEGAALQAAQRNDSTAVPLTDEIVTAEQAESDGFAKAGLIPRSATINNLVDRRFNAAIEAATAKAKENS